MSTFQACLLPIITIISGFAIVYAICIYLRYLHKKANSPPETDKEKGRSRKRRLFEGLEPQVVLVVFVIAFISIPFGWSLYYSNCIEGSCDDTPGAITQTATISEWLKQLLRCQVGCAAFFISLAFIMIRLSTSAFSIRIFNSILNPLNENKGLIWVGVIIYCLAALECLVLVMALSFQVLELPELKTFWGFWAVPLLLLLCVVAFEILGLFFVRAFRITQSDHIVKTELNRISSIFDNNRKGNLNKIEIGDKNEIENSLQLISNVINLSIQQYDSRSSEYGVKHLSKKMDDWIERQDITESYVKKMTNSARVALLRGDEITATGIIIAIEKSALSGYVERTGLSGTRVVAICNTKVTGVGVLRNFLRRAFLWGDEITLVCNIRTINAGSLTDFVKQAGFQGDKGIITSTIGPIIAVDDPEERLLSHMGLLIKSYYDLGRFSAENGYLDSTLRCVKSLEACNQELFKPYISEAIRLKDLPKDATQRDVAEQDPGTEDLNLYDLSIECVKSASIVSQIAAKKNYEMLVVKIAGTTSHMHGSLYEFLSKHPCLPKSTGASRIPKNLIYHYIWSIKDAGVSAANNNLEWGAIKYIESLEDFGQKIFCLIDRYTDDDDITTIAILMIHTSTAIREIGQQLAKGKFQEGSIKAMSAIKELASKALTKPGMMWILENRTKGKDQGEDNSEKLAFVRATWNIKDIGRSAAESGIEKAVVRAVDELFQLLKEALSSKSIWKDNFKKTEGLLGIGEGFYEIAMMTKEQGLQDALTKIIYYNVISVGCLTEDTKKDSDEIPKKDFDEIPARDMYLKTFVDLQPVDEFSEETIRTFLKTLTLDKKLKSYEAYKNFIDQFSKKICVYCSQKSPQQPPDPDVQADKGDPGQEGTCPHRESVQDNESHKGEP
ncbi:hypothetical protein [Methanoculleus bourgensis]|uniref:hypothetical protein n=1 Tax=Methanoculleus bourgensis TaxID=83986 RepID=UPI002493A847|nr:hypothetical protein [Methanoculleus bourgensis]